MGPEKERAEVARVLVEFGHELEDARDAQVGGSFSGVPEADALLERDPNAFLLGVLFTQGIPAERAWQGPWLLRQRLGTLDLAFLAENPELVREAVQHRPMLHRFRETLPRWISAAARRLLDEYGGDARAIWPSGSTMGEVAERLSAFQGIGRKKAVMATEILARHFRIELAERSGGQVAYDIQVRRVFLRSGLAEKDSPDSIEAAAAEFSPEAPGLLDLAAWLVGRQSCRPRAPLCDECRLGEVCPRMTWIVPEGVGVRSGYSAERNSNPVRSLG